MSARRILNGTPGTRWRNDTKKVRWQAVVSWQNSCGRCIANDHAISTSKWPFPAHRLCACRQIPIYPGQESLPFVDFRAEIDRLPAYRRQHVIGKAALKLVENHVLRWPDVVRSDRIKPLHELVARHKLTVERMVAGGVDRRTAERAFAQAHGHDGDALAEAHRKAMAAEVAAQAEQQRAAKEATKARLAAAEAQLAARPKPPKPVATAAEAGSARVLADYLRRAKVKIATIEQVVAKRFGKLNAEAEAARLRAAEAAQKKAQAEAGRQGQPQPRTITLEAAVAEALATLPRRADDDLIAIHEVRAHVGRILGPAAARSQEFDAAIKGLRRQGHRVIAISDLRDATPEQIAASVEGINETLFYIHPKEMPPPPPPWSPRPQSGFGEIRDSNKIEEWGKRVFEPWAEDLPPGEQAALRQYAGENYKWMNGLLRGDASELHRIAPMLSEAEAMKTVDRIDAALRKGKTDRDLTMFRGIKDIRPLGIDPATVKEGDEFTMEGFSSATLKEDVAHNFATQKDITQHTYIIKLNVPEGSTGAYLNAGEFSGYVHEREFLMPHGAKFRFVRHGGKVKDAWGTEVPVIVLERVT